MELLVLQSRNAVNKNSINIVVGWEAFGAAAIAPVRSRQPRVRGMKEEEVGTVSDENFETNLVYEEVTQRLGEDGLGPISFSLYRDKEH